MKNFRGLVRGVGNQPLLLAAVGVVLVGFVASIFSQSAVPKQSRVFNPNKPSRALVLGDNLHHSGDRAIQGPVSGASNPQNPSYNQENNGSDTFNQSPDSSSQNGPDPVLNPPISHLLVVIPTPMPDPIPQPMPCNYCTPTPGRFCPMVQSDHVIYPCSPCGVGSTPGALSCRELE